MEALDFVQFWGLVAGKEALRIINHRQTVDVLPFNIAGACSNLLLCDFP